MRTSSLAIVGLVSSLLAVSSCRSPREGYPTNSIELEDPTPMPAETATPEPSPSPKPTLVLKLPEAATELIDEMDSTVPLAVVTPVADVTEVPEIVQSLSKFKVSVDERRNPLLHYRFSKPTTVDPPRAHEPPRTE